MTAIPFERDVEYPESDGQPMAETGIHVREMAELLVALRSRFASAPDVYVSGNQFLYYRKGDPRAVVAPDIYVVTGTHKEDRRTYKLWDEGKPPAFVLELTSDSTRDEDLHKKKDCYERIGVRIGVEEYFLSDTLGDYLRPPLQGFRLQDGRYHRIAPEPDGSLLSRALGLKIRQDGERLRLIDAATGEILPRSEEVEERRQQTAAALRKEEDRRRREEALRLQAEARRQESEARLAEEMAARRTAEEEIARLRRELEKAQEDR
jgi:Uma2 family endonuclease